MLLRTSQEQSRPHTPFNGSRENSDGGSTSQDRSKEKNRTNFLKASYGTELDTEEEEEGLPNRLKIHLLSAFHADPENGDEDEGGESSITRTVQEAYIMALSFTVTGSEGEEMAVEEPEKEDEKEAEKETEEEAEKDKAEEENPKDLQEEKRIDFREVQERPLMEAEKEQLDAIIAFEKLKLEEEKVEWEWNPEVYGKEQVSFGLLVSPTWSIEVHHGRLIFSPGSAWEPARGPPRKTQIPARRSQDRDQRSKQLKDRCR